MPRMLKRIVVSTCKGLFFSACGAFFLVSSSYSQPNSTTGSTSSSSSSTPPTQQSQPANNAELEWVRENWMAILPIFAFSGASITYLVILWRRPLWLLYLPARFTIPSTQITLTPGIVLWLKYRPRVLDAWVDVRIEQALAEFESRTTVEERLIHISLPVSVDRGTKPQLTAEDLQIFCKRQLFRLVIVGEGGIGKTSLACQIAKWSMSDEQEGRICAHRMIPVLIEEELEGTLLDAITLQIRNLRNDEKPVSEELLTQLLEKRRVLVIVDHLSEMSEETRKAVRYKDPKSPVNALIVTSRLEDILGREVTQTTLKPQRVSGKQLSIFMDDYLKAKEHRELFEDEDYFDALRRLSQLVTEEKEITVLLARLYADQMISVVQDQFINDLPTNIPDLILSYLNELNRNVQDDRLDDTSVQQNAKVAAWECLRNTFKPETANRKQVIEQLLLCQESSNSDQKKARNALDYLEKPLSLVRTIAPAKTRVRFTLDPLAEYLAALHLVERFRDNQKDWQAFFEEIYARCTSLEEIQGFLLALRNCCEAESGSNFKVPESIIQRLEQLAGLDPEILTAERLRRRIRRLMSDLSVAEPEDRQRAAREIGKIGPDAKDALTVLIRTFQDADVRVRSSAIQSIGKLGQSSELVIQNLMQASQDTEPQVRAQAVLALIELGDVSNSTQMRFLELLGDTDAEVQISAILGLGAVGNADEITITRLTQMLESSQSSVCLQAAKTLVSLGQSDSFIIRSIMSQLDDEDYRVRAQAADLIGELDSDSDLSDDLETVLEKLEYLLNDRAPGVRTSAAKALIQLDQESELLIKGLLALLRDTNANVRSDAARKLGTSNNASREVIEELEGLLEDKDYQVRASAAEALGKLDWSLPSVLEKLTLLLDDKYPEVQSNAAKALGELGNSAKDIIEKLLSLLKNKNQDVQISAIGALGKLHNIAPLILKSLTEFLDDSNPNIRFQAASALLTLGQTSEKIVGILCEQLLNGTVDNRLHACELLRIENISSDQSVSTLLQALEDQDMRVQVQSAYALAELDCKSEALINKLIQLLRSKDFKSLEKAIQALGILGNAAKAVSKELLYFLNAELPDFEENEVEDIRYETRETLIKIGDTSDEIIHQLFQLFSSEDEDLRRHSLQILEEFIDKSDVVLGSLVSYIRSDDFDIVKNVSSLLDSLTPNSSTETILEENLKPLFFNSGNIISYGISAYFLVKFNLSLQLVIAELSRFVEKENYALPAKVQYYFQNTGNEKIKDSLDIIILALANLLGQESESRTQLNYIFRSVSKDAYSIIEKRLLQLLKSDDSWTREKLTLLILSGTTLISRNEVLEIIPSIIENISNTKEILESKLFNNSDKLSKLRETILSIRKSQKDRVQIKIIEILIELEPGFKDQAVEELIELLGSHNNNVCAEAAKMLSDLGDDSERVILFLYDKVEGFSQTFHRFWGSDADYVYEVSKCLKKLKPTLPDSINQLLIQAFVRIFDQHQMIYMNYHRGPCTWVDTVVQINLVSELIIQRILTLLNNPSNSYDYILADIFNALGSVGKGFKQIQNSLLSWLDDSKVSTQCRIIRTIGQLRIRSDVITQRFLNLLTDNAENIRNSTVSVMINVGDRSQSIIDTLHVLIDDQYITVRLNSAESLLNLGLTNKSIINTLMDLIFTEKNDVRIRSRAIYLLFSLTGIAAHYKNKFYTLLNAKDTELRLTVVQGLLKLELETEVEPIINTLLDISFSTDEIYIWKRRKAIRKIGDLKELYAFDYKSLLPLLDDKEISIRIETAKVLIQKNQAQELAVGTLLSILNDPDVDNRYDAVEALGELDHVSDDLFNSLIKVLDDPEIDVRVVATDTLAKLDRLTEPVIDVLVSLLKHKTPWIRRSAIEFIGKLKDTPNREIFALLRSHILLADDWCYDSLTSLYQLSFHSNTVERELIAILDTDNINIQKDFISVVEDFLKEEKTVKNIWINQLIYIAYGTNEDRCRDAIEILCKASEISDFASQQFGGLLKSNIFLIIETVFQTLHGLEESPPDFLLETLKRLVTDDDLLASSISAYFSVFFGVDAPVSQLLRKYLAAGSYELPDQVLGLNEDLKNGLDFIIAAILALVEYGKDIAHNSAVEIIETIEIYLEPLIKRMFEILEEGESHHINGIQKILILLEIEPVTFLEKQADLLASDKPGNRVNYDVRNTLGVFSRISDLAVESLFSALEENSEKALLLSAKGDFEAAESYFNLAGDYFNELIEDQKNTTQFISERLLSLLGSHNLLLQGIAAYGLIKLDISLEAVVEKLRLFIDAGNYELPFKIPDDSQVKNALDIIVIATGRLLDDKEFGSNVSGKVSRLFERLPNLIQSILPRLAFLLLDDGSSIYEPAINILVKIDLGIKPDKIVSDLIPLLKDDNSGKRAFVVDALEQLNYVSEKLIHELSELLWDEDKDIREKAISAIANLKGISRVEAILI